MTRAMAIPYVSFVVDDALSARHLGGAQAVMGFTMHLSEGIAIP